jgi:hypothetical protein
MRIHILLALAIPSLCLTAGCGESEPRNEGANPSLPAANIPGPAASESEVPKSAGIGDWKTYAHRDDDFTFAVPGAPGRVEQELPANYGVVSMIIRTLNRGEIVYTVASTEYTEAFVRESRLTPPEILHRGLEAAVHSKPNATVIDRQAVPVAGPLAVEQTFTYPEGMNSQGAEYPAGVTFHRAILDGSRLYLLQLDVSQVHYDANGDEVFSIRRQFFDSFQLRNKS